MASEREWFWLNDDECVDVNQVAALDKNSSGWYVTTVQGQRMGPVSDFKGLADLAGVDVRWMEES